MRKRGENTFRILTDYKNLNTVDRETKYGGNNPSSRT